MKMKSFIPNGFKLHKVETQSGDRPSHKDFNWTMTIYNDCYDDDAVDLKMFVASYNRKARTLEWRNFKNELIEVNNIGPRNLDAYVKAFAKENYDMAVAGKLRRPQLNLTVK